MPRGASSARPLRTASPSGTRAAISAMVARSSRSALSSPAVRSISPVGRVANRQLASTLLSAHVTPSVVAKLRRRADTRACCGPCSPSSRPLRCSNCSGCVSLDKRSPTSRMARSTVAEPGCPSAMSTQARSAPRPSRNSNGRSTYVRSSATSTCGSSANTVPRQWRQSPARATSDWFMCARSVKRSPQVACGVASMRRS